MCAVFAAVSMPSSMFNASFGTSINSYYLTNLYDGSHITVKSLMQLEPASNFDTTEIRVLEVSTITNQGVGLNHIFSAEHVDIDEAKSIFETNYSHVYYVLYDTFITAEGNLRQKGN